MAITLNYSNMPGLVRGSGHRPSASSPSPASIQPRIAYFITRDNGHPVALIPADEFPAHLNLQSVPRVLTPQDTYGLHYVGSALYTGATFKIDHDPTSDPMQRSVSHAPVEMPPMPTQAHVGTGTEQFLSPDDVARGHAVPTSTNFATVTSIRPASAAETSRTWRRPELITNTSSTLRVKDSDAFASTQSVLDAILPSSVGAETAERLGYRRTITPPPSGRTPDQDKKTYCTHWILHGDCAYVQQGCRYKHEMPDKAGLAQIGIKNVPRWWAERHCPVKFGAGVGFGGGVAGSRTLAGPKIEVKDWLKIRNDSVSTASSECHGDENHNNESTDGTSVASETVRGKSLVAARKKGTEKKKAVEETAGGVALSSRPKTSTSTSSPPSTPKDERKTRKPSYSGDLIDFEPLVSIAVSPISISSITSTAAPGSTSSKSTSTGKAVAIAPATSDRRKNKQNTKTGTKVFVPRGERPSLHIADVKKRAACAKQSSSPKLPVAAIMSVCELTGMMTSRHAPPSGAALAVKTIGDTATAASPKRLGPNCRPRRPIASPPHGRKKVGDEAVKKMRG